MFLEKIEIQGFKSFAETVTLVFNRELTAIVGPNGSGKSNIADAIRWVLGEQSLKLLRGKKSDDVIFAGSDTKARLGFARVVLHMNNRDHRANIDYDEVVIERTIDRNGESDYRVNGAKVRLIDIQLLLARAQVGQKSYSVIGQGTIDTLLAFTASERKDFFDEATGVKQYQLKKHQALHKLEQTEENLTQAELVLKEIEPRLRTLTRQVRRLERKEDLERQLKTVQDEYYSYLLGTVNRELAAVREKLTRSQNAVDELSRHEKSIQNSLDAYGSETSRDTAYDTLQKKLFNAQEAYNTLAKKKIILEGQGDIALIKNGDREHVLLKQRRDELAAQHRSIETERDELAQNMASIERSVKRLTDALRDISTALKKTERELSSETPNANASAVHTLAKELAAEHDELVSLMDALTSTEQLPSFKDKFTSFARKLKNFFKELTARPQDRERTWASFTALTSEHAQLTSELHAEELKLAADRQRHESLLLRATELLRELSSLDRELGSDGSVKKERLSQELADLSKELAAKETEIQKLRQDIDSFHKLEEGKKQELMQLQKKLRTLQYDHSIKNNELTVFKVEVAKLETRHEDLEKEVAQEAPHFTQHETRALNEAQALESIATFKKQLAIIGGIDTETIQEYREVKEKHTFLSQQTKDLRAAQKSLTQLIAELDEHINKQFQASFKSINALFTKYFKKLFSGGTARLILTMQTDQPEAEEDQEQTEEKEDDEGNEKRSKTTSRFDYTVEIQATPPGKKLSGIAMLSGGEKALTSIALICSIIANNPPPFVVLDEVDAALDEANSIRFAEIIGELVDKTQFITITHNRATMHQAQILYGVTMNDEGISKLLSVNFEQADKISA